jgi:hypothetical protein
VPPVWQMRKASIRHREVWRKSRYVLTRDTQPSLLFLVIFMAWVNFVYNYPN